MRPQEHTRSNKSSYLANVLSIALADGEMSPRESMALGVIVQDLGASHADLVDARIILRGASDYRLRLPREAAGRLANIEDMILMALADGELRPEELKPVERMIALLGINQADADAIVARAQDRLRLIVGTVPPAAPAAAVQSSGPQRSRPPVRRGPPPVAASAARPAAAVAEAPPLAPAPEAPAPMAPVEAPIPADARHDAPAIPQPVRACMLAHDVSALGLAYCCGAPEGPLNPWGCRLLKMDWAPDADWLTLGNFRDADTFVFDRPAIETQLHERMEAIRACPYFHAQLAAASAARLPSRATTAGRWRHRRAAAGEPGEQSMVVREYAHGCQISSTIRTNGMDPVDGQDAARLIARAARAVEASPDLHILQQCAVAARDAAGQGGAS